MALTTFGAIMGFAAEIVRQTGNVYQELLQQAGDPALREALRALSEEEAKNLSLMEKVRRENVTEMILEPVAGLREEDYAIDLKAADRRGDADLLKTASLLMEREISFFSDASARMPLPEVARIFRKIAQRKQDNLTKLQSLGLNKA